MVSKLNDTGVSPILAIILMIAVTLMLAGIVSLWVFSFLNDEHEPSNLYLFEIDIDANTDSISIILESGKLTNTSYFKLIVDDQSYSFPVGVFKAGDSINIFLGFDSVHYETYHVKIVLKDRMIFEKEITAI